MLQFIFTNLLMLAVGLMLYLLVRTLPRLDNEPEPERKHGWLERWIMSEIPHRLDQALNFYRGKFLRKFKVWLLKVDNLITQRLRKLNTQQDQTSAKKIDSSEITEDKSDEVENS